jgi:hypothetical protein
MAGVGVTLPESSTTSTPGLLFSTSAEVYMWYESNPDAYLADTWHKSGSSQYGVNQKFTRIYVAPGVVPLLGSLTDNIDGGQIWLAPWVEI